MSDSMTVTSPAVLVGTLDADVTIALSTTDMPPRYPTLEQNIYKSKENLQHALLLSAFYLKTLNSSTFAIIIILVSTPYKALITV